MDAHSKDPNRVVYANPWFRVVREGRWHWLEQAPAGQIAGAVVMPVHHDGVVVLSRRRASQGWGETLELPRGARGPGETPAECALRELAEETGLVIGADRLHPLGCVRPDTGVLSARVADAERIGAGAHQVDCLLRDTSARDASR